MAYLFNSATLASNVEFEETCFFSSSLPSSYNFWKFASSPDSKETASSPVKIEWNINKNEIIMKNVFF